MKEPLEIIASIKDFISSQNPLRFPHQETILVDLLNELENTLNPQPIEEPVVEEPIIEELTEEHVEDISESLSNILSLLETGAVEEPIAEVVVPKTTRKK